MSETVVVASTKTSAKKSMKSKKAKSATDHPKYSSMITAAIGQLKERGGSSRQAILKYITTNYKLGDAADVNKINARLKLAIKSGVKAGSLKQSKGTGASGSFRLGEKKSATEKPVIVKKPKVASKKPKVAAKKPATTKPKSVTVASKKVAKPKTLSKSPKKSTARKPKSAKTSVKSPAKNVSKKPAVKKTSTKKSTTKK